MPVDEAQAVHLTIQDTQMSQVPVSAATQCDADINANTLSATATGGDFEIHYFVTTGAAAALTGRINDATTVFSFELLDNSWINGVLYYPAGSTVIIDDSDNTNPMSGCATLVAESQATAVQVL